MRVWKKITINGIIMIDFDYLLENIAYGGQIK